MIPPSNEFDSLLLQLIDGRIEPRDAEQLQQRLLTDESLRRRFVELSQLEYSLGEVTVGEVAVGELAVEDAGFSAGWQTSRQSQDQSWVKLLVIAACIVCVCGAAVWMASAKAPLAHQAKGPDQPRAAMRVARTVRVSQVEWATGSTRFQADEIIPAGPIEIESGELQVDLLSGVAMFVSGPARLSMVSDWRVKLFSGTCRFRVPAAAKGFTVEVAGHDVIDLGTEFVVDASDAKATVRVLEGVVLVSATGKVDRKVREGESLELSEPGSRPVAASETSSNRNSQREKVYADWVQWSRSMERDPRLIAYYPVARSSIGARGSDGGQAIANASVHDQATAATTKWATKLDISRFFVRGRSLNFSSLHSGVKMRVDGVLNQLTLAAWVRIDELPHVHNGLFLTDHFDPGEPHWYLTKSGEMQLVMMSGTQRDAEALMRNNSIKLWEQDWYRHYRSPVVWTPQQSGKWMHLATVYDPINQRVEHYHNGKRIAEFDRIGDRHRVEQIRIGTATMGDWGKPYQTKLHFRHRFLHGAMDDFMLFNAALSEQEIAEIYHASRPD